MKYSILSIAIALPILGISISPTLAEEAVNIPKPLIQSSSVHLSPMLSQPLLIQGEQKNQVSGRGEEVHAPGGMSVPKPKPGPRPPRKDVIFTLPIQALQPSVLSAPSMDVKQVAPGF